MSNWWRRCLEFTRRLYHGLCDVNPYSTCTYGTPWRRVRTGSPIRSSGKLFSDPTSRIIMVTTLNPPQLIAGVGCTVIDPSIAFIMVFPLDSTTWTLVSERIRRTSKIYRKIPTRTEISKQPLETGSQLTMPLLLTRMLRDELHLNFQVYFPRAIHLRVPYDFFCHTTSGSLKSL
jgi:hypothetical protein